VLTQTLQSPIKELTTGSTFAGRYQIIEELGKGGMGKVYKVFDQEVQAKMALKSSSPRYRPTAGRGQDSKHRK
jgi:serine/threonine-protein kinase